MTGESTRVAELLGKARESILEAEAIEDCSWCRSHIRSLRLLVEDLQALARLSTDMKESPELRKWLIRTMKFGEEIGILSFLAHIFHRFRRMGIPRQTDAALFYIL